MTICEQLKEEYLKAVMQLMSEWKENSAKLREEDSNDEAIFETIKFNVGDIFYKIFNVSFNKTCKKVEPEKEELNNLSETYLKFFEKISAPWKEKMIKDKEYSMMEEYYKEQLKLETVEKIKNLFLECYHRYCEEN